jgi:hypothetical protein
MSNINYKVGDKPIFKNDLKNGEYYGPHCFQENMLLGDTTIKEILVNGTFKLENFWYISPEMLEPVAQISDIEKKITYLEKQAKYIQGGIDKYSTQYNQSLKDLSNAISNLKSSFEVQKQAIEKAKEPKYPKFEFALHMVDFCNGKVVVNCSTEESANKFLGLLDGLGVKWCSGLSLLSKTNFNYGEKTTYFYYKDDGSISVGLPPNPLLDNFKRQTVTFEV